MTTEVLIQPVPPADVERRVSPRGMTNRRTSVGGSAATSRTGVRDHPLVSRPGAPSDAAGSIGEWWSALTRPGLRRVALTTLRNVVLITIALLLILVLLPAVLSAQWASVG
jgi:hypothetical protein